MFGNKVSRRTRIKNIQQPMVQKYTIVDYSLNSKSMEKYGAEESLQNSTPTPDFSKIEFSCQHLHKIVCNRNNSDLK